MYRTAALALLFYAGAAAQEAPPVPAGTPAVAAPAPAVAPAPAPAGPRVTVQTRDGAITLELNRDKAPLTTANFLKYVDQKRLDGTTFYRALKFPADAPLGLVQFGVRGRSDKVLPPVAHEPTSKTGLSHIDGAISMARTTPGSAQADFFIIVGNLNTLDANEKDPGYAVFGKVVDGMDVVRKIIDAPTSPTAGEGAMKGQMLTPPIPVATVRRAR